MPAASATGYAVHPAAFDVVFICPTGHVVHCRSSIEVPAALTYVPGTQFVHGVHVSAFATALNPPLAHAMHVRSVVGLPGVRTSSPGTQLVIGAQAVAGLASSSQVPLAHTCLPVAPPAQNVPTLHGAHSAGEVDVGAAFCSVPAAHTPCGRHVVWFGDDEYVPAVHGAHWRSATALPGLLT